MSREGKGKKRTGGGKGEAEGLSGRNSVGEVIDAIIGRWPFCPKAHGWGFSGITQSLSHIQDGWMDGQTGVFMHQRHGVCCWGFCHVI